MSKLLVPRAIWRGLAYGLPVSLALWASIIAFVRWLLS